MKTDKTVLVAVLVLIGLIIWLINLSLQRSRDISRAIDQINTVQQQKPEKIDYDRIQKVVKEEIAKQVSALPAPQNGVDGTNGANGAKGDTGAAGEGVYQLWLKAGNTGTIQDFLHSLKGEKGDIPELPTFCSDVQVFSKKPTDLFWQILPSCTEAK